MRDRATPIIFPCWITLVVTAVSISMAPPHLLTNTISNAEVRPPARVILFPPLLAAYLTIDETASHVLAVPQGEKEVIGNGLLGSFFSISSLPIVPTFGRKSATPSDPEQALLLSPDRIVVWAWAVGGLDKLGLPITFVEHADIDRSWRSIGVVAEKVQRTDEILESFDWRLNELEQEIARTPIKTKTRAIVLWGAGENLWRLALGGNRHVQYLPRLGVEDLGYLFPGLSRSTGSITIGVETLLKLNPDVIFLTCCASSDDLPLRFHGSPDFRSITAVRDNRVYKEPIGGARMDGAIEWPLLMRWYAEILLPTMFERNLRKQFRQAYRTFYGAVLSDDQLDRLLSIEENAASLHYGRFFRTAGQQANP